MIDDKSIPLIAGIIFMAALVFLKNPVVNINTEERAEVGRYQFYPERKMVFDTSEGIIYSFDEKSPQKEFILLGQPRDRLADLIMSLDKAP
jgi:hypothetical protein